MRDKKLVPGQSIKVIDNVNYYLNVTFAASVGTKTKDVGNKTANEKRDIEDYNDSINNISTFGETLYFNIKEYKDYSNYNWKEDAENGEFIHGEMGDGKDEYNGNKLQLTDVKNGYIYVFDTDNKLKYTFELKDGAYQELEVNGNVCVYTKTKSDKAPCAIIKKFITDNPEDEHHECRFVFSKVKLSESRLKGDKSNGIPQIDSRWFYRQVPILKYQYLGIERELRPGVLLLHDYRKGAKMPELQTYHLSSQTFDKYGKGISIHYPDPLLELKRRAKIFQKRFEKKEAWESTKSRVQQLFLYTTVNTLITRDSGLAGYADKERMKLWYEAYQKDLLQHTRKVQNAASNLIKWYESHILYHTLYNYFTCNDKEVWADACEAYAESLLYLKDTQEGRNFLKRQIHKRDSFINYFLGLDSDEPMKPLSPSEIILREAYIGQDKESAAVFAIRKSEQALFKITEAIIPALLLHNEIKARQLIKKHTSIATGGRGKLVTEEIQPLQKLSTKVKILELKEYEFKINKVVNGKPVVTIKGVIEAFNIYYSLKVLLDDPTHKERNFAALVGSTLDFTATMAENKFVQSWLLKAAGNNLLLKNSATKLFKSVPVINLLSGVIDFFAGTDAAYEAYKDGEYGLATGYALYGVGGAICAVGTGITMAAVEGTAASAGTLVEAGLVVGAVGLVVQGIGLGVAYYYDNRAVKDWIKWSIFGDETKLEEEDYFHPKDSDELYSNEIVIRELLHKNPYSRNDESNLQRITSKQIESINHIMCDFKIDVQFREKEYGGSYVTLIIEPGLITENSVIKFSKITAIAEARWLEYIQDSTRDELATGTYYTSIPDIRMDEVINNPKYVKKDKSGLVRQIKQTFYYEKDIDRVKGIVDLQLNSGTLQGVKPKSFNITAPYSD